MSQETDHERIPLLRRPFYNLNYIPNNNNNRRSFNLLKILGFGFIVVTILLLSINLAFFFIESNEAILPKGDSKIPYEYYLGLRKNDGRIGSNNFEYVIETSPQSDAKLSKLFIDKDENDFNSSIIAEIVSRSYKSWSPAYYEVRENRNSSSKNFTVLTTQSHMSGLWFVVWPPKVYISFVTLDDDDKENNNEERKTRFFRDKTGDLEKLLRCEFEIRWDYKYFGEIYRKCSNKDIWKKVAYVKGSSEWGMQWLDPERVDTYGIVTKPAYGRDGQMRNVMFRPDSPFPPIIPALYVAYFDRIIDGGELEGRKFY
ncbi:1228_t:CDS:2 [Funneliformis caledonium]|uniref:1228_t:CDS:1 n=1 Tax=Funneliformis caledonium TaxID=1117310 RepID=A0A9N9GIE5_9GLOM|nr:1228_t:CDS:2 [Funneliformis caledonium]